MPDANAVETTGWPATAAGLQDGAGLPLDEVQGLERFEDLLAYDWQDSRGRFFSQVRLLYQWAADADHSRLRGWMANRIARTAGSVRPPLSHSRLWPLAFLLGQDRHLIAVESNFEGYATFLYRGQFHAAPVGTAVLPDRVEGGHETDLISGPTLELLHAQIRSIGRRAGVGASMGSGPPGAALDVFWLPWSDPSMVGPHGSYNIIAYADRFWAVPQALGSFDLTDVANRSRAGVIWAESKEKLIDRLSGGSSEQTPTLDLRNDYGLVDNSLARAAVQTKVENPLPSLAADPLITRNVIAEHTFPKIIGPRKLITVVIPYFRKAETISRCLDALRDQQYDLCCRDDIEIVVVDDGTPDDPVHQQLPEDVHYLWQRKIRFGASRARNTGAKISNGRYLVFIDPDIIVSRHYFDAMLRSFGRFGDRTIQCGYISDYFFTGCPEIRVEFGVWEHPGRPTQRFYVAAAGSMAISRRLFDETPGFDEDLIYGGVEDIVFGYHVGLLPDTAVVFNRDMEARHIPHPPGSAHADPGRSWEIVKAKWPELYHDYVVNGSR